MHTPRQSPRPSPGAGSAAFGRPSQPRSPRLLSTNPNHATPGRRTTRWRPYVTAAPPTVAPPLCKTCATVASTTHAMTIFRMTVSLRRTLSLAAATLLLGACAASAPDSAPVTTQPTLIPTDTASSATPSPDGATDLPTDLPADCSDTVNLTLILQDGTPVGTGAVLVARPNEPVRIVVETNTASTLRVVGTQVVAEVAPVEGLSLCASFPRGRFPITLGGTQVASIDTSDPS